MTTRSESFAEHARLKAERAAQHDPNRLERHLGAMVRESVKQLRVSGAKSHATMLADAFIAVASKPALAEYCNRAPLDPISVDGSDQLA